jgi:hypothetical protein
MRKPSTPDYLVDYNGNKCPIDKENPFVILTPKTS